MLQRGLLLSTTPSNDISEYRSYKSINGCTLGENARPLRDIVCDELRSQIISGMLAAGSRLVEDRLAAEMGVSRNPVREALRVLETEGFVDFHSRRGAFVATLSKDDADEIFDIRSSLESLAAESAAKHCTEEQGKHLLRITIDSAAAVAIGDFPRVVHLNTVFHDLVLEIGGNKRLFDIMKPLRGRTEPIFSISVQSERAVMSVSEHTQIALAVGEGRELDAAQLAATHVERARETFHAHMAVSIAS